MDDVCVFCRGTGWKVKQQDGIDVAERCSCVEHRKKQTLLQQARIPKRYENCTLDTFSVEPCGESQLAAKRSVEYFVKVYPSVETGLLLMGPPGTGKTHLAVAALRFLIQEKGSHCIFYDFRDLLKTLQSSYTKDTPLTELTVLYPVLHAEVLLLDELGASKMSPWIEDTLAYILNHRYNEKLITLITSNWMDQEMLDTSNLKNKHEEETLNQRIGNRLRSRLYEMCETIQIDPLCRDYRQHLHASNKTRVAQSMQKFSIT